MTLQDASSDDGSTASRPDQGHSTEVEEVSNTAPEGRGNRSSIYSLYSRAHNMVLHGRDHNSDGDIGRSSHGGGGEPEMLSFAESEVQPPFPSPVDRTPILIDNGDTTTATTNALHPLDLAGTSLGSTGREAFTQRGLSGGVSSSLSGGGKKHQTVLGAVFGKFRKSVG
jgi:hypothetical protein